jgi:bifunctional UDP-N-acetylglucosamine pyrophosphorylase / glucosamine-1-phosphate N-acetyltransferase
MSALMSALSSSLAIILAAGEGTRMRSSLPKVLHKVAGRSLVGHAIRSAQAAGFSRLAVVTAPDRPAIAAEIAHHAPDAPIYTQQERLGTGHAALCAKAAITGEEAAILILFGDTPLLKVETMCALVDALDDPACALAVLGFEAADPTNYGRLIIENGNLLTIREHKDASEAERKITLCNGGMMALRGNIALTLLKDITNNNAKGEYYLTDCVALARQKGFTARAILVPEEEALGVDDRVKLAFCEKIVQERLRKAHMQAGVTLIAPETVFFSTDTILAQDVLVEPHVVFGTKVTVGAGAVIHAFSHLEGAEVGAGASVGPFARLRPGTKLGADVKIGNFVEIKNAAFEAGAKASHLSYIGDASVGAGANIGAGTITCNYDGFNKFKTEIGTGAFIGSNSSLVAPVTVGDGAYVGSGSVITKDVPADAFAVARGHQVIKEDWATAFREKRKKGE